MMRMFLQAAMHTENDTTCYDVYVYEPATATLSAATHWGNVAPPAVYLNADERRHYRTALRNAKQQWEALKHVGGNARLQAHALLQPMRRICSGGK